MLKSSLSLVAVLTNAEMCVDAGISSGARQVLVLAVRYVLVRLWITVLLRQTEVNNVYEVTLLAEPHQEVVWLNITVDEVLRVYVLYATYLQQLLLLLFVVVVIIIIIIIIIILLPSVV